MLLVTQFLSKLGVSRETLKSHLMRPDETTGGRIIFLLLSCELKNKKNFDEKCDSRIIFLVIFFELTRVWRGK